MGLTIVVLLFAVIILGGIVYANRNRDVLSAPSEEPVSEDVEKPTTDERADRR